MALFSRQDIIDNLREVAEILGASGQARTRLIVVGGSYMGLQGLREATRDIDTITILDGAVTSAVHEVSRCRGKPAKVVDARQKSGLRHR